jgi:hypothetical protein
MSHFNLVLGGCQPNNVRFVEIFVMYLLLKDSRHVGMSATRLNSKVADTRVLTAVTSDI